MRAVLVLLACCFMTTGSAEAQTPLDLGTPEAAFSGGPIRLSKTSLAALRQHYQGDKVPLIPQPFRGRLDQALAGRDWPKVLAAKKELAASRGMIAALMWEQSRFIATGGVGIAEVHAQDVAASGSTGVAETAAMLWLYATAVTLTDGHKCADPAVRDAHLDRLRGPEFATVTQIVRTLPEDRLTAMRDLAVRLETVLAPDRTDDTMCREGGVKADLKPDPVWKPEAVAARALLPRHLLALCTVMRPKQIAQAGKPGAARQIAAAPVDIVKPVAALAPPVPEPVYTNPEAGKAAMQLFDPGDMALLPVEPAQP